MKVKTIHAGLAMTRLVGWGLRALLQHTRPLCMPADPGCYLEVLENRKLVFTDALGPGSRPKGEAFMTAAILLEPEGTGTRYTAIAMHADPEGKTKHEEMGFLNGWNAALD